MASLLSILSKLPLRKDAAQPAKFSAPKLLSCFYFRSRLSKSRSNTESGAPADKTNRRSLRWKASLTRLLNVRDWDQIRDLLNDADAVDVEKWIRDSTDFMGQTALHRALQARAPIDVVCLLLDSTSCSFERTCDCSGRTPLHVATGWGSGADVVARLLSDGPSKVSDLVQAKDLDGRTALHLACLSTPSKLTSSLSYKHVREQNANQEDDFLENRREVVRVLLDACATVATTADNAGKLPLDYAMERGDDPHLICSLRGPTKRVGLQKKILHRPNHAFLTSQTYSRSTHKKTTLDFKLRTNPDQLHDPLRNFLSVDCLVAAVGSSNDQEKFRNRLAASVPNSEAVPREIRCPSNWKDDVSAITQPKGLEPRRVLMVP